MDGRHVSVRVVQPLAGPLDPHSALTTVIESIAAASGTTDLLVLPELATTRYDIRRHIGEVAPLVDSGAFDQVRAQVSEASLVAVIGMVEVDGEELFNSAVVIDVDGSIAGIVRKSHLFAGERKVFSLGALGVAICYDIEFPEVARSLALTGADMLVVLSANMHPYTDYHVTYAKARAMENQLPLALSNWVGQGPRFDFLGRSCIVSAQGQILADAGDRPGHADATLCLGPSPDMDADLDYLGQRRPELYRQ